MSALILFLLELMFFVFACTSIAMVCVWLVCGRFLHAVLWSLASGVCALVVQALNGAGR